MTGFVDEVIKRVRDYDASRPRSQQLAVGWSEAGGCRSAIGFRLDGAWPSDETDTWAAQRGTAIHEYLEHVLTGTSAAQRDTAIHEYLEHVTGPGIRTEVDTVYRGIPGHADLVGPDYLVDFKSTSLASSKLWADNHSLLRAKRIQVHGYAAGLVDAGELPGSCTVRLLVIPVDGTFADWWAYEEPFDRALADEGADRVEWVRARVEAGEPLPKDMPYVWCETWCQFVSLCRTPSEAAEFAEITDPEYAAAVARYGEINTVIGPLEKEKKQLAGMLRGLRGTAAGWRVSTGAPGEERTVLDEEAVRADYEARGVPVPQVTRPGAAGRLTVTRINGRQRNDKP